MEKICYYFKENGFSNKEISLKKKKIYDILIKNNLLNNLEKSKITKEDIRDMFILYDHIFLFDQFYQYLTNNNIKVDFIIENNTNHDNLGTTSILNNSKHTITLFIDNIQNLIIDQYIKIGGIKCYNKLQCLMNVFEHELIHFMIHIFCLKIDFIENEDQDHDWHHGESYQKILKNIFGHSQFYYLNLKQINKTQVEVDKKVKDLKKKIKLDNYVESYKINNKIKKGNVIEINSDYLIIKDDNSKIDKLYFEYIDKLIV
tara:strand:- start:302 stop:1078 length:777 start_codon:yes stop_codon:yes gene_type:complete